MSIVRWAARGLVCVWRCAEDDAEDRQVSHMTFFTDESIDDEVLDELVEHQTKLGQAHALFDNDGIE